MNSESSNNVSTLQQLGPVMVVSSRLLQHNKSYYRIASDQIVAK